MDSSFGRINPARLSRALWLLLIVAAALMLVEPLDAIPRHAERDYNEGANALKARRVAAGAPMYPPAGSLLPTIYPPLSFLWLSQFSDPLQAGRITALGGLLATALLLGWIVRRAGGDGKWTGTIVIAYMAAHHNSYVAMNDPQWLAHALMVGGLASVIAGERRSRLAAGLGGVLMVLALLVKHSIWPLPAVTAWWLWSRDRRKFRPWATCACAAGAIAATVLVAQFGWATLAANLDASRPYALRDAWHGFVVWLAPELPFVVAAVACWRLVRGDSVATLFAAWAVIAVPYGVALRGGLGADRNHLFEAVLALCALSGLLVARCAPRWRPWLMAGLMSTTLVTVPFRIAEWGTAARVEMESAADVGWLAAAPGPFFAARPVLLYWAGRDTSADAFDLPVSIALRRVPAERLLRAELTTLQLTDAAGLPMLPPEVNQRWLAQFRLVRTSANGFFYVRKDAR